MYSEKSSLPSIDYRLYGRHGRIIIITHFFCSYFLSSLINNRTLCDYNVVYGAHKTNELGC